MLLFICDACDARIEELVDLLRQTDAIGNPVLPEGWSYRADGGEHNYRSTFCPKHGGR